MSEQTGNRKNTDDESREDELRDVTHIATGGEPQDDTGPELDPMGSDPESNVTGRSKPASDGVAQQDRNEHKNDQ